MRLGLEKRKRGVCEVSMNFYLHKLTTLPPPNNPFNPSGLATSFFNDKNRNMVRDLVELLQEAKQELPKWLEAIASETRWGGGGGGGRGRSGGGKRFGGGFGSRDYRQVDRNKTSHSGGSSRPGFSNFGGGEWVSVGGPPLSPPPFPPSFHYLY